MEQLLKTPLRDRLKRGPLVSSAITRNPHLETLTRPEIILLSASFVALIIFACVGIERWVWLDEANSILIALRGPRQIPSALAVDNNLPLYSFVLWGWSKLFGISEIALRMFSVLCYFASCGVVYLLARRICRSRLAGVYAFLFFAFSSQAIHQAHKIRMYSLLGCLSALSVLLWFMLFRERRGSRRLYFAYTLVTSLGLLTHVYFGFVLAAEICACVVWLDWKQVRRLAGSALIAASVFGLLWGRIFLVQLHSPAGDWTPRLGRALLGSFVSQVYGRWGTVLLVIALSVIFWSGRRRLLSTRFFDSSLASLTTIVAISYLLPLAISVRRPIFYPDRYSIAEVPALTVLLAAAVYAAAPRKVTVWLLSALMAIAVTSHIRQRGDNPEPSWVHGPKSGDRVVSSWLLERVRPGDAVVYSGLSRASIHYYFLRSGVGNSFLEISYPQAIAAHLGWSPNDAMSTSWETVHHEAALLTDRLRRLPGPGRRIWLISDGTERSKVLKSEFDKRLQQESATEHDSWAIRAIYSYDSTPAGRHE